jgi:tetratricopeptide (TPR) repeat protein
VGHGNYALVFDRQFEGEFYHFSKGEDYFDRAHNNIVEIATTTGLIGLAAYLFMFSWAVIYLIKAYRENKIKLPEFAALAAFLASYFVQNLALFDCLASYLFLMIILGLINNLYHRPEADKKERDQGWTGKEIWMLVGGGLLAAWLIWAANITTIKMLNKTIDGIIAFNQGKMMQGLEIFKQAQAEGSPLVRDGRSAMINALLNTSYYLDNLTDVQRTAIFSYAIDQGKKNLEYNPNDNFLNMQLAQLLELASQTSRNNLSVNYAQEGLQYVDKSIENGREHILPYYVKAQLLMDLNQVDEAIATLKEALAISTDYWDTYCHLSRTELQSQVNVAEAYDFLDKCLDKGGAKLLGSGNYLNEAIKHYQQAGDIDRLTMLTEQLVRIYPQGAEIWLRLTDLYHQQGRDEEAQYAAQQAISLKPDYKAQVEEIMGQGEN